MKFSFTAVNSRPRFDPATITEPLASIIDRFYEPSKPRVGDRSALKWWVCPFHPDRNPSLCVDPKKPRRWKCFGCDAHGDAIEFVRQLNPGMGFLEAVNAILGQPYTPRPRPTIPRPVETKVPAERPPSWPGFAAEFVAQAEANLWAPRGAEALRYLTEGRGLTVETIRAARLGCWPEESWKKGVFPDKPIWLPQGVVIPWFDGSEVTMVNIRRPEKTDPKNKYHAIKGSRRGGIYPSRDLIRAGRPVIVVEGEFEALYLGQVLDGIAPVVTLGSASDRPKPQAMTSLIIANPWYIALDDDEAGNKAAEAWNGLSKRCVRVKPPQGFEYFENFAAVSEGENAPHCKDWEEAGKNCFDINKLWYDILYRPLIPGHHTPAPPEAQQFTQNTQNPPTPEPFDFSQQWGPALEDDEVSEDATPDPVTEPTEPELANQVTSETPFSRPSGNPMWGLTRRHRRVVALESRTDAQEESDPVQFVTGEGWPDWYPVEAEADPRPRIVNQPAVIEEFIF